MRSAGEEMRESGECGRADEAGESEGGISSERLSKISGLLWRGELGARPSCSAGLTAVVKLCSQSHTYSEGVRQCHSLGK